MKRNCLNCGKEFEAKRDIAKFHNTSCRVLFSRKNKGNEKREAEKSLLLQTNVLLNSVLDAIGKINYGVVPTILDAPMATDLKRDEPPQYEKPKPMPFKTLAQYKAEKLELESEEQYAVWLSELQADPNFSSKQKDLIIKYN